MIYILFFLAGILQDFLGTINMRYIAKGKVYFSVITSFLVTVVSMSVLYNILTKMDSQRSLLAIVIYAAGIGTGTFFAMKFKIGFKE